MSKCILHATGYDNGAWRAKSESEIAARLIAFFACDVFALIGVLACLDKPLDWKRIAQ